MKSYLELFQKFDDSLSTNYLSRIEYGYHDCFHNNYDDYVLYLIFIDNRILVLDFSNTIVAQGIDKWYGRCIYYNNTKDIFSEEEIKEIYNILNNYPFKESNE